MLSIKSAWDPRFFCLQTDDTGCFFNTLLQVEKDSSKINIYANPQDRASEQCLRLSALFPGPLDHQLNLTTATEVIQIYLIGAVDIITFREIEHLTTG